MERRALFTAALLASAAVLSSACNDLGSCDDPAKGRTTVTFAGDFMFTGQAIITQSCGTGCHVSGAKDGARQGAPAGLDFNLKPIADGTPVPASGTPTGLQLDPTELAGLRSRQRTVYEQRELIWSQIEKGLMPPKGASQSLMAIARAMFGGDQKCAMGAALTTLGEHKEELRNWLACDTPVVEAASAQLPYKPLPANAPPEDQAAGCGYYSIPEVSIGYQYPACGGGGGTGGGAPAFSEVYTKVFSPSCAVCHTPGGLNSTVDFSTESAAYTSLMGANGMGKAQPCAKNMSPYVTPNDATKSYLINKMDSTTSTALRCDDVMPQGTGSTMSDITLVKAWIMGGALRMPAAGGGGGADAGAADAGR